MTVDIDGSGIHPANKIDVGQRLARWALAKEYGKPVAFSGPLFNRREIDGEKVVLHFSHAESGLMVATKNGLAPPLLINARVCPKPSNQISGFCKGIQYKLDAQASRY